MKSFNQSDCILEWNGYSTLIFLYEIASRCYIWSYVEINIFDLTYTNGLYLVNAICINHRDSSERHPKWNKRSHYDWNWCRDLRNDALISRCRFPDWRDSRCLIILDVNKWGALRAHANPTFHGKSFPVEIDQRHIQILKTSFNWWTRKGYTHFKLLQSV